MSTAKADRSARVWQRVENAIVALSILLTCLVMGQPWWMLFAAFPVFDLSVLGCLVNQRTGTLAYNVVHNYSAPAAVAAASAVLMTNGFAGDLLFVLAACWAFHIGVDRALGFGLKLGPFSATHLSDRGAAGH